MSRPCIGFAPGANVGISSDAPDESQVLDERRFQSAGRDHLWYMRLACRHHDADQRRFRDRPEIAHIDCRAPISRLEASPAILILEIFRKCSSLCFRSARGASSEQWDRPPRCQQPNRLSRSSFVHCGHRALFSASFPLQKSQPHPCKTSRSLRSRWWGERGIRRRASRRLY